MIIRAAYRICPSEGQEPDYRETIPDANTRRRMSRIVKMGVASALGCLDMVPGTEPEAVITATALGCLADTEKFLIEIGDRKETMLNPSPFIYSTFNTVAGQIALVGGIRAYNMTYVNGGCSFNDAMRDAALCIAEGMDNILVVAYDENTPTAETVMRRIGREYIGDAVSVAFLLSGDLPGTHRIPDSFICGAGIDPEDMSGNIREAERLYRFYMEDDGK